MSDLFERYGQRQVANEPDPLSNIQNTMQRFNEFAKGFSGNPEVILNNLLKSGEMSQAQYNKLSLIASALSKFVH